MKVIILDDEKEAAEALRLKLGLIDPSVEFSYIFNDPVAAIPVINQASFDVLFLDIDMPGMNGFEVLSALSNKEIKVIFVTAYSQYSIKAIKANAFDYLLKPIDSEELKTTLNRLRANEIPSLKTSRLDELHESLRKVDRDDNKLMLNSQNDIVLISMDHIMYLEAKGNYCIFHTADGTTHLVTKPIGDYEDQLKHQDFFRIHKTFLVNMKHIQRFDKSNMMVEMNNKARIEVASRRKNEFLELLQSRYNQ